MKIGYFDCIAGASGDMILGAMLDAGLDEGELRASLAALDLSGYEVHIRRVSKKGIAAVKVDVQVLEDVPHRRLAELLSLLHGSGLEKPVREKSEAILRRLAEVEAQIHGTTAEEVHLHELGAVDTLVDIVGTLAGLEKLGIEAVYASPLPLGRGFVESAHGPLPLPAPATLRLLEGVPIYGSELDAELVTPTGAALLVSQAKAFGPIPAMRLTAVGYGAGGRDLPIPNVMRLLVGEADPKVSPDIENLVMLESNIDDLNPEVYDYVFSRLFESGALDVFLTPVHMKKNRPGVLLTVLAEPGEAADLSAIIFAETTTLGIRQQRVERMALERETKTIETALGPVRIKVARWGEGQVKFAPEYEDCRALAERHKVPLLEVYRMADALARSQVGTLTRWGVGR